MMLALPWSLLAFVEGKTSGQGWSDKSTGFGIQDFKCMGHLGEVQSSFPFPGFPLDYFDVQDLKILLGMISFEIIVASLQHYNLKCIFARVLDHIQKTSNFDSANAFAKIEVSFTK